MLIRFERSGGYANLKLSCEIDTENLRPQQARELVSMVERAVVLEIEQPVPGRSVPDSVEYRLVVRKICLAARVKSSLHLTVTNVLVFPRVKLFTLDFAMCVC